VRRFSALSLGGVALLAATGFINSWFLVGSFSNLIEQTYGRWLLAKIILFCFAVAICGFSWTF
jgi:putative copper export protein